MLISGAGDDPNLPCATSAAAPVISPVSARMSADIRRLVATCINPFAMAYFFFPGAVP
jgi:hypothetical protein